MSILRWFKYRLPGFQDGGIRIVGPDVIEVPRAEDADVIVVANCLFEPFRKPAAWDALWADPLIRARPSRVVAYDCADDECIPPLPGCHYFRCGAPRRMCDAYPSLIAFPWPSPDLGPWAATYAPEAAARPYVASFVGWSTGRAETPAAVASVRRAFPDTAYLVEYQGFHGHAKLADGHTNDPKAGNHRLGDPPGTAETVRREDEYRRAMFGSLAVLAPQSIPGVLRYRVTEASSCARVPVIVGDGHVFPFADRIPWDDLTIQVPSAEAHRTGEILLDRLTAWGPDGFVARGQRLRAAWERWLDKDRHPALMAEVVRERLGVA